MGDLQFHEAYPQHQAPVVRGTFLLVRCSFFQYDRGLATGKTRPLLVVRGNFYRGVRFRRSTLPLAAYFLRKRTS